MTGHPAPSEFFRSSCAHPPFADHFTVRHVVNITVYAICSVPLHLPYHIGQHMGIRKFITHQPDNRTGRHTDSFIQRIIQPFIRLRNPLQLISQLLRRLLYDLVRSIRGTAVYDDIFYIFIILFQDLRHTFFKMCTVIVCHCNDGHLWGIG